MPSEIIGYAVIKVKTTVKMGDTTLHIFHSADGFMGGLPVYRTKTQARKAHGRKVKLTEVFADADN